MKYPHDVLVFIAKLIDENFESILTVNIKNYDEDPGVTAPAESSGPGPTCWPGPGPGAGPGRAGRGGWAGQHKMFCR